MSKPIALLMTLLPIRPMPMTASVRPETSSPSQGR